MAGKGNSAGWNLKKRKKKRKNEKVYEILLKDS